MRNIIILLVSLTIVWGCSENKLNPEVLPISQTLYPVNLTNSGATFAGNMLTGGSGVITRGFYYLHNPGKSVLNEGMASSELKNYLLGNGTKVEASLDGDFQYRIGDLQKEDDYCVLSFVECKTGISYGDCVFFTTSKDIPPTVSISADFVLEEEDVTLYCMIDAVGGGEITERGIVWGYSQEPTLETGEKITTESGYGDFEVEKEGIEQFRKHYFRAYAKNEFGVAYSDEVMVIIMSDTFVDKRDNQEYRVKQYGNSVWMLENFRYIPPGEINLDIWVQGYEGNDTEKAKASKFYDTYGCLYTYQRAIDLAPEGWHLATDQEWIELEILTGLSPEEANMEDEWRGGTNYKLKADTWEGVGHWDNEMGFGIHPSGKQWCGGAFQNLNELAFFWTATMHQEKDNPYYRFFSSGTGTGRFSDFPTCVGQSVRYVMD